MINPLQPRFGTKGTVLQWFNRYSAGIDFGRQNPPSVDVRGPFHSHSRSDIAHLHMMIVRIVRVGQSSRILTMHVKERDKRGKQTSFYHCRKRQESGHEKFGNKCTKNGPQILTTKATLAL